MMDCFGRSIDYMRISVTDRCNLRCIYCVTESGVDMKPMEEILSFEEITRYLGLNRDESIHGNSQAIYYKIPGFLGSIGFISPIHGVFCSSCNRIRLSAAGELKPCLCYGESHNLRNALRTSDDAKVKRILEQAILEKPQKHCFDNLQAISETHAMVSIGG